LHIDFLPPKALDMKRLIYCLLSVGLMMNLAASWAQNAPLTGQVIIKGKIAGLDAGTATLTTEVFGQKQNFNATISQGKFEFTVNQPSPTLYSMVVNEDQSGRLIFFADNGILQIDIQKGNVGGGKVSGSISNRELNQYNAMVALQDQKLEDIKEIYANLEPNDKMESRQDSLEQVFQQAINTREAAIQNWVLQHPKSFVSPLMVVINYGKDGDAIMLRKLFDAMAPEVKASYYGNYLETVIVRAEGLNIGKLAPAFSQADANGKPIALESYKGKYVLVDFWASWCGPCRQENPNLVRTYHKFKHKNFDILGVSLDNNKTKWLQAIEEDQLTWKHVSDLRYWQNEVALQYGVKSIPANFLLDKEGKIIAKGLRGIELERALEKLLQ
jgi:peroxiredoxin